MTEGPSLQAIAAEQLGEVFVAVGEDARILECNAAFARICAAQSSGLVGQPIGRWLQALQGPRFAALLHELERARSVPVESPLASPDTRRLRARAAQFETPGGGRTIALFGAVVTPEETVPEIERARLEFLLGETEEGVFDWDLTVDRALISPAGLRMFALDGSEQHDVGDLFGRLVHPDERPTVRAAFVELLAGRSRSLHVELRAMMATGQPRWLAVRARVAERAEDGRALRVVGTASDISARRRFEESLRRERDLLDAVMGTSVTALVVQNPDGALIYANPEAARLLGTSRSRLLSGLRRPRAWAFMHPDGTPCALDEHPFRRVLDRGEPINGARYDLETSGRRVLHLSVNSAPTRDADGRINRIVSTLDDVGEQLRNEAALRASERALREVLDRLPVAVAVILANGTIQTCNPAAAQLLGTTIDDLIGRDALHTQWPMLDEDGEPVRFPSHPIFAAWIEGRPVRDVALVIRPRVNEQPRWVLASAQPRSADNGGLVDVVVTLADITPRKQMEISLLQAQKVESIGRLAGGIAHDFNNLLTAVLGSAELLRLDLEPDHPSHEDLDRVIEAAERGAALTGQLLAYARRQPIQPRVSDLSRLVLKALAMLERLLGEDIRLHVTSQPDVRVCLDPGQFDQLLINLAVNARDALPSGGDIFIEIDDRPLLASDEPLAESAAVLRVRDSGTGMSADVVSRIFEPFYTTKASGEGTGLGLAVCFGVAKQNGGVINVQSEPGVGTTFEVVFPREARQAEPSLAVAPGAPPSGQGTVLLVEDDTAVRETARRALTRAGFTVITAPDGEKALFIIESGAPLDGVVTDVVMPDLSGRPLADAIAEHHPEIPLLFTSGHADDLLGEHGIIRAGVDFLPKPYTPETLARRVTLMLARTLGGVP